MERPYNSQAFTPEEVEKGLHLDLLNYLLDHNKKNETRYYDIHITTDGYCTIIEWTDVDYNQNYDSEGKFDFVPYNGQIMLEYIFPDNHCEMCYDEEDFEERLKAFLKENPGWVKTSYGTWTNEIENEQYKKMFEESKTKEVQ